MNLFDRFHAAFDIAPPAGGFERLRRELTSHSAAPRRRPAFRMRLNKMGFRLAAAVAAAVIAIALLAGYLALQRQTTGGVPAGSSRNVSAYQSLMMNDNAAWVNQPFNCKVVTDASCAQDLAAIKAIIVQWRSDLGSQAAPQQFAVIDAQIKRHLDSLIRVGDVVANAISTGNQAVFDAGNLYAGITSGWLKSVTTAISATRTVTASQYTDLLHTDYSILSGSQSFSSTICASLQDALCQHDLGTDIQGIGEMQADLIEYQAPEALAGRDLNLQKDAAQADDALMRMGEALVNNDAGALKLGSTAFSDALVAVSSDLQS